MNNLEIRTAIMQAQLHQWQVAKALGISESVFSRRLREEMSEATKEQVLQAIKDLTGGANET